MITLTKAEEENVLAAIHFLKVRLGTWKMLALALRTKRVTIRKVRGGKRVKLTLAKRVARLAGISVDDLKSGYLVPPETCPHCGYATARM